LVSQAAVDAPAASTTIRGRVCVGSCRPSEARLTGVVQAPPGGVDRGHDLAAFAGRRSEDPDEPRPPAGFGPDRRAFGLEPGIAGFGDRASETRQGSKAQRTSKLVPAWYPLAALRFDSNHEKSPVSGAFLNSGGRIRTCDLRVMSPTSYLAAPPRDGLRMVAMGRWARGGRGNCAGRFPAWALSRVRAACRRTPDGWR
jgi:hypothetical protein